MKSVSVLVLAFLVVTCHGNYDNNVAGKEEELDDLLSRLEGDLEKRVSNLAAAKVSEAEVVENNEKQPQAILPIKPVKPILPLRQPCFDADCCDTRLAFFDLSSGRYRLGPDGIELNVPIDKPSSDEDSCNLGGQIKINFEALSQKPCNVCMDEPQYGRRMLKLEFFFAPANDRNGWMFGIGDSESSNGYGGDGNTQLWDSEVDGQYPNLNFYSNDVCKNEDGVANLFHKIPDILDAPVDKLTMYIANGFVRVVAGSVDTKICSKCLFATNNQADVNVNTDIFVSFNRVVNAQQGRSGRGLCRATASWVCPLKAYP